MRGNTGMRAYTAALAQALSEPTSPVKGGQGGGAVGRGVRDVSPAGRRGSVPQPVESGAGPS